MITIYSDAHFGHAPQSELLDGRLQPIFERPERARRIIEAVREAKLGVAIRPKPRLVERAHEVPGLVVLERG